MRNPQSKITLSEEKFEPSPLKSGMIQGCPLSTLLYNPELEVPAGTVRKGK